MKPIFKIASILAFLSVIVSFYYFRNNPIEKNQQNQDLEVKPQGLGITDFSENNEVDIRGSNINKITSNDKAISTFESSLDAGESLEFIEQLFDAGKDDLAKGLLRELDERCGSKDNFEPLPDTPSWVFENIVKYCKDYDASMFSKLLSEEGLFNIENPNISSLVSSEETDIDKVSSDFLYMLTQMNYSSNEFMADVADTIAFYSSDLKVPLDLGQSENISPYEIANLQIISTELYACERFGGCGPNSHQVLSYCFIDVRCMQGWSLIDYYQNTLSPISFNEVMNMLGVIRRYERGGSP